MSVATRLIEFIPFSKAGEPDFFTELVLPARTNWLIVGILDFSFLSFSLFTVMYYIATPEGNKPKQQRWNYITKSLILSTNFVL